MTGDRPIRVLVAEGRALHRAAMSTAFAAEADFQIIGQAAADADAIDLALRLEPDVVSIDAVLPVRGGPAVCQEIKARRPEQRVLVIDDRPDSSVLLAAVRAGADGYATKRARFEYVANAVRDLAAGRAFVPPDMLRQLLRDLTAATHQAHEAYEKFLLLTRRERQVLELVVEGFGNAVIAEILVISPSTARTHVREIVRKLGAGSRLEVAALAVQHDWLRSAAVANS
ncbi:MAG: LuxR C-terminal-related transcriptional regulator [Egibacteraceae bacterium]